MKFTRSFFKFFYRLVYPPKRFIFCPSDFGDPLSYYLSKIG